MAAGHPNPNSGVSFAALSSPNKGEHETEISMDLGSGLQSKQIVKLMKCETALIPSNVLTPQPQLFFGQPDFKVGHQVQV